MKILKHTLFIIILLILQTVIIPRLNFFGVIPDLILVTVIILAVRREPTEVNVISGLLGFVQDLLSAGCYLNTILKVLAANIVLRVKDGCLGNEESLIYGLVAIGTPLYILAEKLIGLFFFQANVAFFALVFQLIVATGYNLLFVPLLLLVKELAGE